MGLEIEIHLSDEKTKMCFFAHSNLQTKIHTCSTCFSLTQTLTSSRENEVSVDLKDLVQHWKSMSHQGGSPLPIRIP